MAAKITSFEKNEQGEGIVHLTNLSRIKLTPQAAKLYEFLLQTGGAHESKCLEHLFPSPGYPEGNDREAAIRYWQWESNCYGGDRTRAVGKNGSKYEFIEFHPDAEPCYATQTSEAYQELRRNGLVTESNNGFNSYTFFPVKK